MAYGIFAIFFIIFGLIISLMGAFFFIRLGLWTRAITNLSILLITSLTLFPRKIPFKIRKRIVICINFFLCIFLYVFAGPKGLAPMFIALTYMLLAIFEEKNYIRYWVLGFILIYTALTVLYTMGKLDHLPMSEYGATWWLNFAGLILGGLVILVLLRVLISGLHTQYTRALKGEAQLKGTLNAVPSGIVVCNSKGDIRMMNPAAKAMAKREDNESIGYSFSRVFPLQLSESSDFLSLQEMLNLVQGDFRGSLILIPKDSKAIRVRFNHANIKTEDENVGHVIVIQDVSREHLLQEKQKEADKLEALGKMAGGIAHDFNNMLSGILGYTELIERKSSSENIVHYSRQVIECANHAKDLTESLLNFARRTPLIHGPVNLGNLLRSSLDLVKHSHPNKSIQFSLEYTNPACWIEGDQGLLQNSLVNLIINGCDAMEKGGMLTLRCREIWLDPDFCSTSPFDITSGPHWLVEVEDQGHGMDKDTREKIFDPFFTTKELGKGTGLGLSSVYSTMKDHFGALEVDSEPQRGSVFKLYFPVAEAPEQ